MKTTTTTKTKKSAFVKWNATTAGAQEGEAFCGDAEGVGFTAAEGFRNGKEAVGGGAVEQEFPPLLSKVHVFYSLAGGEIFPYGCPLEEVEERLSQIVVVACELRKELMKLALEFGVPAMKLAHLADEANVLQRMARKALRGVYAFEEFAQTAEKRRAAAQVGEEAGEGHAVDCSTAVGDMQEQ